MVQAKKEFGADLKEICYNIEPPNKKTILNFCSLTLKMSICRSLVDNRLVCHVFIILGGHGGSCDVPHDASDVLDNSTHHVETAKGTEVLN